VKPCSKCGVTKPLDQFHRFANARDGRRAECKECAKVRTKIAYDKIRDRYDTGPVQSACRECGTTFEYIKTTGQRRIYCSNTCRQRGSDAIKKARAAVTPRTCACGSTNVKRVGKPVCPDCKVDQRDPAVEAAKERRRTLGRYGLTQHDWDAMVEQQGNRCAICRGDKPGGRGELWHIDHDHETGNVRGLLCHACNVGLGNFRDDPALLEAAAAYIRLARTQPA
jgi:hypothetical protein